MKEDVIITEKGTVLTAELTCEIDHHTSKRIRDKIDPALFRYKPQTLILDFSAVRFMDSSGIALILGRVESASAVDARVHLDGLSSGLFKLVRLSGIERIKNLTVSP